MTFSGWTSRTLWAPKKVSVHQYDMVVLLPQAWPDAHWLFCRSDHGGHTAAIRFSLIATCQRHKVEPFTYLRDVLTRIAAHPISRLAELLPAALTPA
jgi:hypothetical protein